MIRWNYESASKIFSDANCTLISKSYRHSEEKLQVRCECGKEYEVTLVSFKNSKHKKCVDCVGKIVRKQHQLSYKDVDKYLKDNGCKLLSKDYNNMHEDIIFIAKCGHEHKTSLDSFKRSKHKKCPKCTNKCMSGENAYNWNGGYDNEKTKFRKTYEFKQFVKKVLKRDNYKCTICGYKNGRLNVHHLDGYNWCEGKRTSIDNGVTLCKDCHEEFHTKYGRGDNTKSQFIEWINCKGMDINLQNVLS